MLNIPDAIKNLYKADVGARKNFRVRFPNGELPDITNENIVQESVKFTESLCSQQYLRFGLAEAPTIEFETVGIANMYGMKIECFSEIETTSLSAQDIADIQAMTDLDGELVLAADSDIGFGYYRIPLGVFRVESCPRGHGQMKHRRVTAYGYGLEEGWLYNAMQSNLLFWYNQGSYATNPSKNYTILESNIYGHIVATFRSLWKNEAIVDTVQPASEGIIGIQKATIYIDGRAYLLKAGNTREEALDISATTTRVQIRQYRIISGFVRIKTSMSEGLKKLLKDIGYQRIGYNQECIVNISGTSGFTIQDFLRSNTDEEVLAVPTNATNSNKFAVSINDVAVPFYALYPADDPSEITVYETGADFRFSVFSKSIQNGYPTFKIDKAFLNSDIDNISMLESLLEFSGVFGFTNRQGNMDMIALTKGAPLNITPDLYDSLWWDEYDVSPIGSIKYKLDSDEAEVIIYKFGDGQSVYDMTGNEIVKLIDDQTQETVNGYLDALFIPRIQDVYYTPTECDLKGLPYIEAGDYIEIDANDVEGGTPIKASTFVMDRTMTGIQTLTDSITSQGGEIINGGFYVTEGE